MSETLDVGAMSPSQAAERITALKGGKDPGFNERLFKGDAAAKKELDALHKKVADGDGAEKIDSAVHGTENRVNGTPDGELTQAQYESLAKDFEALGIGSRDILNQAVGNVQVTQQEHDAAQRKLNDLLGSPEWLDRFYKRESSCIREFRLANIILNSPIKG
jgi:hypothetical protein